MVIRVRGAQTLCVEARSVAREGITTATVVGRAGLIPGREGHHLVLHVVCTEVVGQVQLVRGALLSAHGHPIQFLRGGDAKFLVHHEALAVVVIDRREFEAKLRIA